MSDISNNEQTPEGVENNEIDISNTNEINNGLQNVFATISETAASVVNNINTKEEEINSLDNTIFPPNKSPARSVNTYEFKEQYTPPPMSRISTQDNFQGNGDGNGDGGGGGDDDGESTISGTIISRHLPSTQQNNSVIVNWFDTKEYIIFSHQLDALKKNNIFVLKECKENKRLLDLKYSDLNTNVNNIQTSVIFFSTISGFIQATREQFTISDLIVSVVSITISTYISLLLSISKYYKLDELKEQIQNLRSKYSVLHNKIEYRMDVLGPWNSKKLWIHADAQKKMTEWKKIYDYMEQDYNELIETKQTLCSEFEIIMDTKSRNKYFIKNKELNYANRTKIYKWNKKEQALEEKMSFKDIKPIRRSSLVLQHEELDNWDDNSEV